MGKRGQGGDGGVRVDEMGEEAEGDVATGGIAGED